MIITLHIGYRPATLYISDIGRLLSFKLWITSYPTKVCFYVEKEYAKSSGVLTDTARLRYVCVDIYISA